MTQVECGHEEGTEIKEQKLVGSSRMKGAEEEENEKEDSSKSNSLHFPSDLSWAFLSCCLIELYYPSCFNGYSHKLQLSATTSTNLRQRRL